MKKKREETLPPPTQCGSNKVPELFREFIGDGTKVILENGNTSPPCDMGSIGPNYASKRCSKVGKGLGHGSCHLYG